MTTQPVILLTFSNSEDAYLRMIVEEQKAIKQALLDYVDRNCLHLRDVQRASTEEVFYLINRYHNRVCILHYGGHADGRSLQLEQEIGIVQSANVKGIAGLLGTQQQLKLVFLNGCATKGQVKALLDAGVQAVIATSVGINDRQAQRFAAQFYEALGAGGTIREAFQKAKALIETEADAPLIKSIDETRAPDLRDKEEKMPWGLYWKSAPEAMLDWKLPTESPLEIDFSSVRLPGREEKAANSILVDTTLKAIRDSVYVRELARKIYQERQEGDVNRKPSDLEKKDAIIRSFPAPIGVHLADLFSVKRGDKLDESRLQQLFTIYQKAVKLASFIMLSDIWDATVERTEPLDLSSAERHQLRAFFDLNEFTAHTFDYFLLGDVLLKVASRNDIRFYLESLHDYPEGWSADEQLAAAHEHFGQMRTLLEGDIPSRLIEPYCLESERHLTHLLCTWNFLVHYKMAVVKNIEVHQIRNMPPTTFNHIMVELDISKNDVGRMDRPHHLDRPTDMESVLLYQEKLNDNLNLSPFVLDEHALIREYNYKVFYFSHRSDDGLHYYWIENEADTLLITDDQFGYVKKQFEKARRDILNEGIGTVKKSDLGDEDDIVSLM